MNAIRSVGLFVAAGLAEIGGGYLIWRWLREGAPWPVGLAGAVILVAYGVIPTFQSVGDFGRIYAAYGGVFVIMSLLWGWAIDGHRPDNYDWLGAAIVAAGVAVIFFSPHHLHSYFRNEACCVRSASGARDGGKLGKLDFPGDPIERPGPQG
ncbi:MAG TPA: YnfA family protein, partial [Streptosporangiaceae bacterium]|nr:YnfA family protein [Streptosporangiaceae bacterium]